MDLQIRAIFRVASGYLIFGFIWILGSDHLLDIITTNLAFASRIQSIKGLIYVILSTFVIILLLLREKSTKETLLSEIHHRVKNNLALISAFLDLEKLRITERYQRSDPDSPGSYGILEDSIRSWDGTIRRIKTMSIVHEILYTYGEVTKIPLSNFILSLWNYLSENSRRETQASEKGVPSPESVGSSSVPKGKFPKPDLNLDVQILDLDLKICIPIALLLQEILSLALERHRALSISSENSDSPQILLQMFRENGKIRLIYRDNLGIFSPADWEKRPDLGFLIVQTLESQLKGNLDWNLALSDSVEKGIETDREFSLSGAFPEIA
jgi:two-component sensor histidine kinase